MVEPVVGVMKLPSPKKCSHPEEEMLVRPVIGVNHEVREITVSGEEKILATPVVGVNREVSFLGVKWSNRWSAL